MKSKILILLLVMGMLNVPIALNADNVEESTTDSVIKEPRDHSHDVIMNSDSSMNPELLANQVGGILYGTVESENSITGNKVCVYVKGDDSNTYTDLVNSQREEWDETPVSSSQDLKEGAMLRAGENVVRYASGEQDSKISHVTDKYSFIELGINEFVVENLATSSLEYDASIPYNAYLEEKVNLPENYNPQDNLDNSMVGINEETITNYSTMINPQLLYVGQGAALADDNCDGDTEYITYANIHSETGTDKYPDLATEVSRNHGGEGLDVIDDNFVDNESEESNVDEEEIVAEEELQEEINTNNESEESSDDLLTNTATTKLITLVLGGIITSTYFKFTFKKY